MALVTFPHQPIIPHLRVPPRHARTLSLHDHILQTYLPWFTRPHHEPDVDLILDSWLRSNPELLEPTLHFPLREREFRGAFYMVIDTIEDADAETEGFGTEPLVVLDASKRLLETLEDEWEEDVETMEESIEQGWEPPPLLAEFQDGRLLLQDGNHRYEAMVRAAQLSGTHEFMGQLANGYDLKLADRGEGLSGGQRQSIAIARALADRPPVVVFDEPSSAMDTQTETGLIARLQAELKGRTLVLITHRPPLLALCDRIILLDGGRVATNGPRDAVLKQITRGPQAAPKAEKAA